MTCLRPRQGQRPAGATFSCGTMEASNLDRRPSAMLGANSSHYIQYEESPSTLRYRGGAMAISLHYQYTTSNHCNSIQSLHMLAGVWLQRPKISGALYFVQWHGRESPSRHPPRGPPKVDNLLLMFTSGSACKVVVVLIFHNTTTTHTAYYRAPRAINALFQCW